MRYRRLGKSGLQVSELSFGSWLTFGKQIGNPVAEKLMGYAYDQGVNFFDNAEIYSRGESEKVMGRILKKMKWPRDTWIVSSKAFFGAGGKLPTQRGLHRKHLVEACEAAMKRLQVDYLDLYFCHRPDKQTPIEETVWTMHNLIQQGKILYWGTSEWSAQEIMEAHMVAKQYNLIGPTMEQPQYNMLHRQKFEVEFEQVYKTVGLGTTIWSPLASGMLTGKHKGKAAKGTRLTMDGLDWLREQQVTADRLKAVERLKKVAERLDMSMPVMALAWCLKNPNVSTVILGASKLAQLKENMKAIDAQDQLDRQAMALIEKALGNAPVHPMF